MLNNQLLCQLKDWPQMDHVTVKVSFCTHTHKYSFIYMYTYIAATDVLTTKPEMWDIIKIVFPMIKAEWQYVAYSMKYAPNDVSTFERDAKDCKGSCLKLFTDWLTTNNGIAPKIWLTLIEQIKEVDGLQQAAKDIEEEVKKLHN